MAVVAVAATGLTLATSSSASARPSADEPPGPARVCVVVLGEAEQGQPAPVSARACSANSSDAYAKAYRQAGGAEAGALASRTLLFRAYDHAGYQGYQYNFVGSYGTCDREGYTFLANLGWLSIGDTMSSIEGFGRCDTVRLTHQDSGKTGTFYLSVSNIGYWNDNVEWIHVYDR